MEKLKNKYPTLKELLQCTTEGRAILLSDKTVELPRLSKAFLARTIIEFELQSKKALKDRVTGDTLVKWAEEVVELFPKESSDIYYVKGSCVGKYLAASGLLANRLITQRAKLKKIEKGEPKLKKRKTTSGYHQLSAATAEPISLDDSGLEVSPESCVQWLQHWSEPLQLAKEKWNHCYWLRHGKEGLLTKITVEEYCSKFLALNGPGGYTLVSFAFIAVIMVIL